MTQEEHIAQLEQENAELRAQLAQAYQQISQLAERLQRVEAQVGQRQPQQQQTAVELSAGQSGKLSRESRGPVQYGPQVHALDVYLHDYQLVPLGRVSELLADLCGCQISEAAVLTWIACAAERLAPTVARIADWLSVSRLQHADETGVRTSLMPVCFKQRCPPSRVCLSGSRRAWMWLISAAALGTSSI